MLHLIGNTDASISLAGAWMWIKKLKYPVTREWTHWISKHDQSKSVGFIKEYGNLAIATVHGEGHYAMFEKYTDFPELMFNFIHGEVLGS